MGCSAYCVLVLARGFHISDPDSATRYRIKYPRSTRYYAPVYCVGALGISPTCTRMDVQILIYQGLARKAKGVRLCREFCLKSS